MQKPMGQDLDRRSGFSRAARSGSSSAAVNFQLRFSPGMLALHDLVTRGALGTLVDIDVRVVIDQPWHLWTFLERAPRVEVPYHSIHYLDAIRWIAGEPVGRVLPERRASVAPAAARRPQLDHPRLRRRACAARSS